MPATTQPAPLRQIVSRPSQLTEALECGHVISRPLGLGEYAQSPSKVKRRRCHLCAAKPAHGTPEFNAIYDAARKAMGYPSRQELAAFDRRFPVYDPTAEAFVKPVVLVQKEQSASQCSAPSYDASRRSSALRQDEVGAA